ncbi:hypothetical protein H257_05428 [Aphanomyces astaci]|uniref:Uncharacterized protein n=1 Tax=Aphanomyces astaci TaxID=112090 RepID=W4GRA7_APHAT|nr:hypothetical protein H257_05428 [Aphanomyces astaci]ETV81871.1 hypothetical protein H257_05428 [Aphanomyces astaci]|eukprot:XP_009828608.1 hypothetical protein H257_05428 [Aphanomyces astaci]
MGRGLRGDAAAMTRRMADGKDGPSKEIGTIAMIEAQVLNPAVGVRVVEVHKDNLDTLHKRPRASSPSHPSSSRSNVPSSRAPPRRIAPNVGLLGRLMQSTAKSRDKEDERERQVADQKLAALLPPRR